MGVSEEDIAKLLGQQSSAEEAGDYAVHADAWDSWTVFRQLQTQWVYAARGFGAQRVGLNYAGVESGLRLAAWPRRSWPELLADLQVMELAVLAADAELAEAATER